MSDIRQKAELQVSQLLQSIHHSLSRHPAAQSEARQLQAEDEDFLRQLQGNQFFYNTWVTLLAIDSYTTSISNQAQLIYHMSYMMTSLLESVKNMGDAIKVNDDRKKIISSYHNAYETLLECIQLTQQISPKSPFNQDQNLLIQNSTHEINQDGTMLSKLRQENYELKKKLEMNDQQLINMEFKLMKLLKQNEETERGHGYQIGGNASYMELREQLLFKEQEIDRMNEEFSYEIQKYNTVYDAMKKQLEQMKGYQNIDLIEQIELLETEVVRLREERERDQIIMRQLRNDNMMFSSKGSLSSPRSMAKFAPTLSPRYDY